MRATRSFDVRDIYLELVKRFPLRKLKNRRQHALAVKVLTGVSLKYQDSRESGAMDYMEVLAGLIDQYEQAAKLKVDTSHQSAEEVVRHLMQANGLSVSGLAREIGIPQSNLSEMLSGRRDFSKRVISRMHDRFGVNPGIFF